MLLSIYRGEKQEITNKNQQDCLYSHVFVRLTMLWVNFAGIPPCEWTVDSARAPSQLCKFCLSTSIRNFVFKFWSKWSVKLVKNKPSQVWSWMSLVLLERTYLLIMSVLSRLWFQLVFFVISHWFFIYLIKCMYKPSLLSCGIYGFVFIVKLSFRMVSTIP